MLHYHIFFLSTYLLPAFPCQITSHFCAHWVSQLVLGNQVATITIIYPAHRKIEVQLGQSWQSGTIDDKSAARHHDVGSSEESLKRESAKWQMYGTYMPESAALFPKGNFGLQGIEWLG